MSSIVLFALLAIFAASLYLSSSILLRRLMFKKIILRKENSEDSPYIPSARIENQESKHLLELTYVTDRKFIGVSDEILAGSLESRTYTGLDSYYGIDRGDYGIGYEVGRCWVGIPEKHKFGKVDAPISVLGYKLEKESEKKHMIFSGLQRLTEDEFFQYFRQSTKSSALLFIHGYNTTFEQAAKRTAQIVFDLKFQGIGMFYSWPSQGTIPHYPVDSSNIIWTESHLADFLSWFKFFDIENLYIIGHSMGTRAITNALKARSEFEPDSNQKVKELILAAPDIDEDVFRKDIAPFLPKLVERTTIYRSADDKALALSYKFNGYPRLGDAKNGVITYLDIDTVDATGFKTDYLGHGDYASSSELLYEINSVLDGKIISKRQRLTEVPQSPTPYWKIHE